TTPEAVHLVLEAGAMGKGGEIFVFDMGKPVKIIDVARKMIQLAGLTEGKDITISFTGLRPGEKLYEEIPTSSESTIPTHHPKIRMAKSRVYPHKEACKVIGELIAISRLNDNQSMVHKMKEIVPEFLSNN